MCRMSWEYGSLNLLDLSEPHRACYGTALPLPCFREQHRLWLRCKSLSRCNVFSWCTKSIIFPVSRCQGMSRLANGSLRCMSLSEQSNDKKVKSNPITGLDRPWGLQEVDAPRFKDNRHMKVVISALRTGHLYPPGNSFRLEAESTPGPKCGRKDYVNEKSNPRPTGL